MKRHKKGRGSKYITYFTSFELVYSEQFTSRSEAMRREIQLKKWPRDKKEALIENGTKELKNTREN